ncbi:MAG: TonB-dependent receptor [Pseudomonadota bacterium]
MNHSTKPRSGSTLRRSVFCSWAALGFAAAASAPVAIAQDAADAEEENTRRLNVVVVEATRREGVTVQDVPVSVTAFDADLLENSNFERVNDLEQLSPSVQITQGQSASAGTSISIRGIGTGADNFGFEPAVGIFVDGVYRTRTGIGISELPEVSGLEVLRGPQGTLFGRNTSAGVVNIRTSAPDFDPTASAHIGFGNFEALEAGFHVNGGLTDNIAARFDGQFRRRDGFIEDLNSNEEFNNIDRFLVRGQLLWEAGEASARFIADYAQTNENCCAAVIEVPGATAGVVNAGAGLLGLIGIIDPAVRETDFQASNSPNRPFVDDVEEFGFSLEYENRLGIGNFTSISAYRDFEAVRGQDIDFSGIDRAFRDGTVTADRTFTQEFRLQDVAGPLDWLVGVFYLNQQIDTLDTIRFGAQADFYTDILLANLVGGQLFGVADPTGTVVPSLLGNIDPLTGAPALPGTPGTVPFFLPGTPEGAGQQADVFELDTNAVAVFSHNEISITDTLTATLGIRYNYENRDIRADLDSFVPACDVIAALPPGTGAALGTAGALACNPAVNTEFNGVSEDGRTENEVTGTARLSYAPTPDWLFFAGYSRGYKSGSFNIDRSGFESAVFSPIDPATGLPISDGPQLSDLEFEEETVNSFEAGFKSTLFEGNMTLNAVGFYQDITDFQENVFNGVNFIVAGVDVENFGAEVDVTASPTDGLVLQGGFTWVQAERTEDLPFVPGSEGLQLGNTPEFVLTGQGTYTHGLTPWLDGFAHMNVRWQSATNISVFEALDQVSNDAFATVGARIGVRHPDEHWEISAFGTNLFDQSFNVAAFTIPEQDNIAVYPGEPRFWGVEFKTFFQ